ncbi:MAG TPA: hypothetical protein VFP80_15880 [Thermoanaerobaculia bacterium]|nr:hypothetical protein [Thermoanaerobaculia bacterium]
MWTTHAQLLCTLGRFSETERAIATAYEAFRHARREDRVHDLAVIRLAKARICHGLGDSERALRLVRRAAKNFSGRDRLWYAEATIVEMQIHRDLGDSAAEEKTMDNALHMAWEKDFFQFGWLYESLGRLRAGDPKFATQCCEKAKLIFKSRESRYEDAVLRLRYGGATARMGDFPKALWLRHRVRNDLLAGGYVIDAAIVSTEILDILLLTGGRTSSAGRTLWSASTAKRGFRSARGTSGRSYGNARGRGR